MPEQATIEPQEGLNSLSGLFDKFHVENTGEAPVTPVETPEAPDTPPAGNDVVEPVAAEKPAPEKADEFVPPEFDAPVEPVKESVNDLMPEEPPVAIRTEKGKADYRKWREHQLSLEKQLKERGTPDAEAQARIAELEKRLTDMSSVTEKVALQEHPAFQQQFVVPRQQMMGAAKDIVDMADGDFNSFESMLSLTGKARVQAVDTLMEQIESPTLKTQLGQLIYQIETLDRNKAQVMQDVKGNYERLQMQERAQRHQQIEQEEKRTLTQVDATIAELRDKAGFEFYREAPGNEAWNKIVDNARKQAAYILTKASPEEATAAAALAPLTPLYRQAYLTQSKKVKALEAELAELRGAEPRLADGGGQLESASHDESPLAGVFKRARESSW